MQSLSVKDLMVPRNQYARISADRTLGEAVLTLQEVQKREQSLDPERHRDRAILVIDEFDKVIGKLSMLNVLRGLLPRYDRVRGSRTSSKGAARVGSARLFIDSQERDLGLWNKPLENLIKKASNVKIRHLIREFADGETVAEDASLDTALHQMIMGRFQSLLVTRAGDITGILRLTDVYDEISRRIREVGAGQSGDE
jgi:CBS domain-containing protein